MRRFCLNKVLILFSLFFFDYFNIYAQNLPQSAYLKSILIEDFEELSQSFIYKDEGNYFVKKDDKYLLKRERTSEFFNYFIPNLKESHYSLELDIKIDPTTNIFSSGGLYISGKPNPKIIFEINNHQEFRIIVREPENKILTTNEDTNGWIHSSHITSTGEFQNIEWVVDKQKHAIYINSALVYT
ncbi:hypothetical protein N9W40_03560, partial [Flavobacteriales bacterium]|nr:hypothetical protein [Flavobacteriales bacterium]